MISVMAVTVEPNRSGEHTATVRLITPASSAHARGATRCGRAFAASAWLIVWRLAAVRPASEVDFVHYFLCVSTLEFSSHYTKAAIFNHAGETSRNNRSYTSTYASVTGIAPAYKRSKPESKGAPCGIVGAVASATSLILVEGLRAAGIPRL